MPSTPSSASAGSRSAGYSSARSRSATVGRTSRRRTGARRPAGRTCVGASRPGGRSPVHDGRPAATDSRLALPAAVGHVDLRLLTGQQLADQLARSSARRRCRRCGRRRRTGRGAPRRRSGRWSDVNGSTPAHMRSMADVAQPGEVVDDRQRGVAQPVERDVVGDTRRGSPSGSRAASRRWPAATRAATSSSRSRSRTAPGTRRLVPRRQVAEQRVLLGRQRAVDHRPDVERAGARWRAPAAARCRRARRGRARRAACCVHAPVAITTMSAVDAALVGLDADDSVPPLVDEAGHLDALADVGALGPRSGGERGDDGGRVDLGVVAAEAGAEHVGADRADELAHLGAVDQLHVEPVRLAGLHELLEHDALLGRVEVDHAALGAELERLGQVAAQLVVERAGRRARPRAPSRGCGSAARRSPGCGPTRRSRRARCSSSVTCMPSRAAKYAVAVPTRPPPTTTTDRSCRRPPSRCPSRSRPVRSGQ